MIELVEPLNYNYKMGIDVFNFLESLDIYFECQEPHPSDKEKCAFFLKVIDKESKVCSWAQLNRETAVCWNDLRHEFIHLIKNWPDAEDAVIGDNEIKISIGKNLDPAAVTSKQFFKAAHTAGLRVCTFHHSFGHFTEDCTVKALRRQKSAYFKAGRRPSLAVAEDAISYLIGK